MRNEDVLIRCPMGHVGQSVRYGMQRGYQRFRCKRCPSQFVPERPHRKGYKFPSRQIGEALEWYFGGLSYEKVAKKLASEFDIRGPDRSTVYDWVREYARVAAEGLDGRRVNTGRVWLVWAYYVEIKRSPYWMWNVMDFETRYLLVSLLASERSELEAAEVIERAEAAVYNLPETVLMDRSNGISHLFTEVDTPDFEYSGHDYVLDEINKILPWGTSKRPYNTLRAMKGLISAQLFLDGWRIDYNLFQPREDIDDMTPAQAAGLDAPFANWEHVVSKAENIIASKALRERTAAY